DAKPPLPAAPRAAGHRFRASAWATKRKDNADNQRITAHPATPARSTKIPGTTSPENKKHKKSPSHQVTGFLVGVWQCPTLTRGGAAVPSALSGFTSEFGMESGGAHLLWPPDKLVNNQHCNRTL